jgi:putative component of membrane protein insertase Oxa1/YidC/SpoIIIJ protein YidD
VRRPILVAGCAFAVTLACAAGVARRARAAEQRADAPALWEPEQAVAYLLGGAVATPPQEAAAPAWDGALGNGVTRALFGTYHLLLSSQDAGGCVFSPSCSRFSQAVIGRCGLFQGALLTLDRLLRDHPLAVPFYPRVEGGRLLRDEPARYCLTRAE